MQLFRLCYLFYSKVSLPLINRLKLTREKLNALSAGIRSIALQEDPIDQVKQKNV